jgi:hypothetical protein
MGDHSNDKSQLQDYNDEKYVRDLFVGRLSLRLDDKIFPWILNHIDCFDRQARLNESIQEVYFYGYSGNDQNHKVWDKVGKAIGNLEALEKLYIHTSYDEDEDLPSSDWEILACILSHVRQKIELNITDALVWDTVWDAEQCRLFAQAIHGHPTITSFEVGCLVFGNGNTASSGIDVPTTNNAR